MYTHKQSLKNYFFENLEPRRYIFLSGNYMLK